MSELSAAALAAAAAAAAAGCCCCDPVQHCCGEESLEGLVLQGTLAKCLAIDILHILMVAVKEQRFHTDWLPLCQHVQHELTRLHNLCQEILIFASHYVQPCSAHNFLCRLCPYFFPEQ